MQHTTTRQASPRSQNAAKPKTQASSHGLLVLQRQAGNTAVAALVQRQHAPVRLEAYEITLPGFVGNQRLAQAKLNSPVLKRATDPTGSAVYAIQQALIRAGLPMPRSTRHTARPTDPGSPDDPGFADRANDPDGRWGEETTTTLAQFQSAHGLVPDSQVGNLTLKALQEAATGPVPILPAPTSRIAGVESFTVRYAPDDGRDKQIRIDCDATFTDDAGHDPDQAEFQQHVSSKLVLRRSDGTETVVGEPNVHDDLYHRGSSRAQTYAAATYHMTDHAGLNPLGSGEEIDFRFTAEQRIVDLSRNGLILARRGPHTVVVTGRLPHLHYEGAPQDV